MARGMLSADAVQAEQAVRAPKKEKNWKCLGTHERELRARGYYHVAGADEVGRGSLFGAVVAGAVILSPDAPVRGLNDSKQLDPERREELALRIRERALAWAVAAVDAATIDRINIYEASRLAMKQAVGQLRPMADFVLVDAVALDIPLPQQPLLQGDERCHAPEHVSALRKLGPTPLHRMSFEPVRLAAIYSPLERHQQMEMFTA